MAVGDYLKKAHATILMSKRSDIVKSYPHSLIESLLTGTPVLISDTIPMADLVREKSCGVVLHDVTVAGLSAAIETMTRRYSELADNAATTGAGTFSIEAMVEAHRVLYGL